MNNCKTDNNNIIINFAFFPFCFRTVSIGEYTNKLRDEHQFFHSFSKLFERDIPAISQYTFDNVYKETNGHSHTISPSDRKYAIVLSILKEIYKNFKNSTNIERDFELFLENNINDYHIWQLGISGGVRIIGRRRSNIFDVLFIDYHHLIYPDKNYNQENYNMYSFCPITNNNNGGN